MVRHAAKIRTLRCGDTYAVFQGVCQTSARNLFAGSKISATFVSPVSLTCQFHLHSRGNQILF